MVEISSLTLNSDIIMDLIEPNSSVLDLGCGDGLLLKELISQKNVKGKGIEIDESLVIASIQNGVSTIQGDIDEGLKQFSDKEYNYVLLNSTVQSTEKPHYVIKEMLRVGKKVIVTFPNFGYWQIRLYLLLKGRMPKSKRLPYEWYDTPNIHLLTIKDFFDFIKQNNITVLDKIYLKNSKTRKNPLVNLFPNLLAQDAIFVLSK